MATIVAAKSYAPARRRSRALAAGLRPRRSRQWRAPSSSRWTARPSSPCWATGRWSAETPQLEPARRRRHAPDKLLRAHHRPAPDATRDPKTWKIKIDGKVDTPLKLTLGDLKPLPHGRDRTSHTECSRQRPLLLRARGAGNQWTATAPWACALARRLAEGRARPRRRAEGRQAGRPSTALDTPIADKTPDFIKRSTSTIATRRRRAARLHAERPGPAADPRRAGAPGRAGLDTAPLDQVADRASGCSTRSMTAPGMKTLLPRAEDAAIAPARHGATRGRSRSAASRCARSSPSRPTAPRLTAGTEARPARPRLGRRTGHQDRRHLDRRRQDLDERQGRPGPASTRSRWQRFAGHGRPAEPGYTSSWRGRPTATASRPSPSTPPTGTRRATAPTRSTASASSSTS